MTLGYVLFLYEASIDSSMVGEEFSGPVPVSGGANDLLDHMNLGKQSILSGKHQKPPVGLTQGS